MKTLEGICSSSRRIAALETAYKSSEAYNIVNNCESIPVCLDCAHGVKLAVLHTMFKCETVTLLTSLMVILRRQS